MLPRPSGSGWTWVTNVTEVNCASPSRKRSDRRDKVVLPLTVVSALLRAMAVGPPTDTEIAFLALYKLYRTSSAQPRGPVAPSLRCLRKRDLASGSPLPSRRHVPGQLED